VDFIIK